MANTLNSRIWIRKLDLMTLRLFMSTIEEGNIGRAAKREMIAASAVTKRIQDMEETLGYKLFYRDPKGASLTPAGEVAANRIQAVLGAIEALSDDLSVFADGAQGHLRLAVTESVLVEYLSADVSRFMSIFPLISVEIQEDLSAKVMRAVLAGTVDVGFCPAPIEPIDGLRQIPYRKDKLVAIMVSTHPLASRSTLSFAEILDNDLIGWADSGALMQLLDRAAKRSGREFKPKYRVTTVEGARSLVRANLGVSIQPLGMVGPYEDADHICTVPLDDDWSDRNLCIVVSEGRRIPYTARNFISFLIEGELES